MVGRRLTDSILTPKRSTRQALVIRPVAYSARISLTVSAVSFLARRFVSRLGVMDESVRLDDGALALNGRHPTSRWAITWPRLRQVSLVGQPLQVETTSVGGLVTCLRRCLMYEVSGRRPQRADRRRGDHDR